MPARRPASIWELSHLLRLTRIQRPLTSPQAWQSQSTQKKCSAGGAEVTTVEAEQLADQVTYPWGLFSLLPFIVQVL